MVPPTRQSIAFFADRCCIILESSMKLNRTCEKAWLLKPTLAKGHLFYNVIASVLMDQERFPESIAFFENAGRAWPDRGANHRGIAEVWLRQGREFSEALDHARQAVEIDRHATRMKKEALDSRRSEEHTSELQSLAYLVCRLLLEKKKKTIKVQDTRRITQTDIESTSV